MAAGGGNAGGGRLPWASLEVPDGDGREKEWREGREGYLGLFG